uniref:Uncharacterized protein n=1 Tax=Prolemur simus TaxID=1328070 RepID=A0A8C9A6Z8_PROSS
QCKLRSLLQHLGEEADKENLQETWQRPWRRPKEKGNECQEPSERDPGELVPAASETHTAAGQPHGPAAGLEKDVVLVWVCNQRQKVKGSSSDYSQRKEFEAARSPFSGGPVSFPLCPFLWPGPHFGTPGYGSPHFTTTPRSLFPRGKPFPLSLSQRGSPMHPN